MRALRKQAGTTQEKLAEKLNVSRQAITKWETGGEKIRVRLASNTLPTLQNELKVRIDDVKSRIDVDVVRKNGLTEAAAKEAVTVFVQIPSPYIGRVELAANAKTVEVRSLNCDNVELKLKSQDVLVEDVAGTVEIDCNLVMNVVCVKNNRSMLACIIFHLFVNTMQEKIAMTPQTKCVETAVVTLAAVLVVATNREMFFETEHIGNLLAEKNSA